MRAPRQPQVTRPMSAAKRVLLLDVDRTSIRTTVLWRKFQAVLVAKLHDPVLVAALNEAERAGRGNNFDPLAWLSVRLAVRDEAYAQAVAAELHDPQALFEWLRAVYADSQGRFAPDFVHEVVIAGFFDVLAAAQAARTQLVLVTAGDVVFQQMKVLLLEALARQERQRWVAANAPDFADTFDFIVIANSKQRKTALAAECFDGQGAFRIDELVQEGAASRIADTAAYAGVEEVIVVDDKPENTVDAGARVMSLLVYPDGVVVDDGWPRRSLKDVAEYIRALSE